MFFFFVAAFPLSPSHHHHLFCTASATVVLLDDIVHIPTIGYEPRQIIVVMLNTQHSPAFSTKSRSRISVVGLGEVRVLCWSRLGVLDRA